MRKDEPNIEGLITARLDIRLFKGQCFKSTPKAYEIWEIDGLRVHRIPKQRVLWVIEPDRKERVRNAEA